MVEFEVPDLDRNPVYWQESCGHLSVKSKLNRSHSTITSWTPILLHLKRRFTNKINFPFFLKKSFKKLVHFKTNISLVTPEHITIDEHFISYFTVGQMYWIHLDEISLHYKEHYHYLIGKLSQEFIIFIKNLFKNVDNYYLLLPK